MPGPYIDAHIAMTGTRAPFDARHEVNILVEIGATAPRDAAPGPDGAIPVVVFLEGILGEMLEQGDVGRGDRAE